MAEPAEVRERLAAAALADEVAALVERRARRYCGEHGIPLSVFQGRRLNEVTTVTYRRDDEGNLVVTRSTVRDPEWLPGDVVAALQHQAEEDAKCSGCGQPRSESFDGATRYSVETHTCAGCAGLEQKSWLAQKNRPKNGQPKFGVKLGVRKVGG